MGFALFALLGVEGPRLEREADGLVGPLDERLSEELGTTVAPVDPGLVARALRDRCDARVAAQGIGTGVAGAVLAEGHQQARCQLRPSARQGLEQGRVFQGREALCDLRIEAPDMAQQQRQLMHPGQHRKAVGLDHARIAGQRRSHVDRRQAPLDDFGVARIVFREERPQSRLPRPLGRLQGRPALHEGAEDQRILVLKPIQHLREVQLQRRGQAVGATHPVGHQLAARLQQLRHLVALVLQVNYYRLKADSLESD